ncbi:hypothetical protein WOLCODRAFT_19399 [Wolfiporia cocos MD-104 SS10]|uniref:Uncharacterized protein n=1 Tax=Wolfiporia cocos (strain MD-104) TaxID=742152 RepID=A0A2H3IX26_WOLCO|nr:hypothetical protein WOLCODRAFT_19399 [Wolfiporia cocos MD-104 SS10]
MPGSSLDFTLLTASLFGGVTCAILEAESHMIQLIRRVLRTSPVLLLALHGRSNLAEMYALSFSLVDNVQVAVLWILDTATSCLDTIILWDFIVPKQYVGASSLHSLSFSVLLLWYCLSNATICTRFGEAILITGSYGEIQ